MLGNKTVLVGLIVATIAAVIVFTYLTQPRDDSPPTGSFDAAIAEHTTAIDSFFTTLKAGKDSSTQWEYGRIPTGWAPPPNITSWEIVDPDVVPVPGSASWAARVLVHHTRYDGAPVAHSYLISTRSGNIVDVHLATGL